MTHLRTIDYQMRTLGPIAYPAFSRRSLMLSPIFLAFRSHLLTSLKILKKGLTSTSGMVSAVETVTVTGNSRRLLGDEDGLGR